MFTHLVSAARTISSRFASLSQARRSLNVLATQQRTVQQENEARRLEAQLFFDRDLLSRARAELYLPYKRQLLACAAALMLAASPITSEASTPDGNETPVSDAPHGGDDESVFGWLERWVDSVLTNNGEGAEGDPDDGKG